jgi:hypothetical protein
MRKYCIANNGLSYQNEQGENRTMENEDTKYDHLLEVKISDAGIDNIY